MPNFALARRREMNKIALRRLDAQQLSSVQFKLPSEVVKWLGAIQAQDYAGAKWSIGIRLPGSSDNAVEQAVAGNDIVRTWAMRGTLHFVAAEDVHWLLALLAPRIIAKNQRRYRQLELDEQTLGSSSALLYGALEGGKQLDRQALRPVLEKEGISTDGQRMFYMLQRASLDGLICQGVAIKNRPAFLRLAPPLAGITPVHREEALARLALRYFTSRGPATVDDFVWWTGLLVADARAGLKEAASKLVRETIAGKTYWLADSMPASPRSAPDLYLLPGFDEYLVSYRDRSAALDDKYAAAWSRSKAMFSPSIILRGQVIGLWNRTIKDSLVEVTPDLFIDLTAGNFRALEETAQAYGRFLGKTAVIKPG